MKPLQAFIKYNIVAIAASLLDFTVFVVLAKGLNVWYIAAAVISAISGGILAFWYNRKWVFNNMDGKIQKQAIKYIIIWLSSILLNTTGIYLLVHNHLCNKVEAKIIISICIGVFFNFLMNKFYVFKQHT